MGKVKTVVRLSLDMEILYVIYTFIIDIIIMIYIKLV